MKKQNSYRSFGDAVINSVPAVLIVALLGILAGVFMIFSQSVNTPVLREEAVSYSGKFDEYDDSSSKYKSICFTDGTAYSVYPHTETKEFREKMHSIPQGTVIYLLVNPNNNYVAEVRTDAEEILNFEASQEAIDSYDNFYIVLGGGACVGSVFLIFYAISSLSYGRKEKARHTAKAKKRVKGEDSCAIRRAEDSVKSRILLEARTHGYKICYRRVKNVNELVINGYVYAPKSLR